MYRDSQLRIFIAEAPAYKGPYHIVNDNVWPECKLEDFYLFKANNQYHMIAEDNVGGVSGHERWGIHLYSDDGIGNWKRHDPLIVYDHDILLENDSVIRCNRRERVQLFVENTLITHILTSVYDGENSWTQPVRLSRTISVQ